MDIVKSSDPIGLIEQSVSSPKEIMQEQFVKIVTKLYQYEFFKYMLDLVATNCRKGALQFKLKPHENFELDEGNCRTFEEVSFNNILNKFKTQRSYIITVKKLTSGIIVHEIGHMLEKEAFKSLDSGFMQVISQDINNIDSKNVSFCNAVKHIMIEQVGRYPESHRLSELFTRYFELLANSKEVAGFADEYAYSIAEVANAFINTQQWMLDNTYNNVLHKIDADIAQKSSGYIKKLEDIKHGWTQERVKPRYAKSNDGRGKWSASTGSIKD